MRRKRLACPAAGQLEWQEDPVDSLGKGDVLVRSQCCALKHGTEWHRIRNSGPFSKQTFNGDLRLFDEASHGNEFPCDIGNMTVGVVEDIGADVNGFKKGQRVFGPLPAADVHVCPASKIKPLGKLTAEQAMSIDPAMFGVGGVIDGNVAGGRVLVTGPGAIGLFAIQAAKARGADVYAASSMPHRRKLAKSFGAIVEISGKPLDSGGKNDIALQLKQADRDAGRRPKECGVDVAIECSGKYHNLRHAIRATRHCGRVVTVGFYDGGAADINFGEEIFHNRLEILASLPAFRWGNPLRTDPPMHAPKLQAVVADHLQAGQLKTDGMLTFVSMNNTIATILKAIDDPGDIVKLVIDFS